MAINNPPAWYIPNPQTLRLGHPTGPTLGGPASGKDATLAGHLIVGENELVRIGSLPSASSLTDEGIRFNADASIPAGVATEVDGELLSFGVNVPQMGSHQSGRVGGLFRIDTRSGQQTWAVVTYDTSGNAVTTKAIMVKLTTGLVGINTLTPDEQLTINGIVHSQKHFRTDPGGSADLMIQLNTDASVRSAIGTEVSGELLSLGINVPQFGGVLTSRVGGIFRIDTRSSQQVWTIVAYDTNNALVSNYALCVQLNDGNVGMRTRAQFGGGKGVVGLQNAGTVPASNPSGGGVLLRSLAI